jgi:cyclase
LVDTGHQEVASELLSTIKSLKEGDIKYIINTHPHGDHAGGNKTCGPNAVVIGYKNLEEMVSKGVLSPGKEKISGGSGKAFDFFYSMNFNGEEIRIIPSPGAHSDSDLIVYFTGSGVVHMGDLLLTQSFPAVGPRVKKYLEILDTTIDCFPEGTKFIGGHGRDYTMSEVIDYREMLSDTIKIVRESMNSGKSIEDMRQENVLKDYESWGVFLEFLNTDTWIEFIYQSYKNQI